MPLWQWLLDSAGAVLFLLLLSGLLLVIRRRWIARSGGTLEFSIRVRSSRVGRGWVLGVARYNGDVLEWFRVFSLECETPSGSLEVAMSPEALTGFLAWLEAAPPGQRLRR